MQFPEQPLTPQEQVNFLQRKGMQFEDRKEAEFHLQHINYHRLRPYWQPFESTERGGGYHFEPPLPFEKVLDLYRFDRKLRLLILDAIERLEVSLRSRWSNQMALRHGPLCLERPSLFREGDLYRRSLDSLVHFYENSEDEFTVNFRRKYPQVELPPIWICSEMLSLGQLARWIGNLREGRDRQDVADAYRLREDVLLSFLEHLTEIRNLCAHHARLWNRTFSPPFLLPRPLPEGLNQLQGQTRDRLHNTLVFLEYLTNQICEGSSWGNRLQNLLRAHPAARQGLGCPLQ